MSGILLVCGITCPLTVPGKSDSHQFGYQTSRRRSTALGPLMAGQCSCFDLLVLEGSSQELVTSAYDAINILQFLWHLYLIWPPRT